MRDLKNLAFLLGLVSVGISYCLNCRADGPPSDDDLASEIVGTWVSKYVDTEIGTVRFELTFLANRVLKLKMIPKDKPENVIEAESTFSIREGRLVAKALNRGEPIDIALDKNSLNMKVSDEDPVKFSRKERPQE